MYRLFCPRGCCIATYCPLVLAWATTIHKFQGFEAGFDESDDINYIIANINNLAWEKNHPGTAYTVTSRAKTIGAKTPNTPHPLNSNLFFEGQIGSQRFTNISKKVNGEKCELLVKRENWVDYLHEREAASKLCRMNCEKIYTGDSIENYISANTLSDKTDLETRIVTTLKNPNRQQNIAPPCRTSKP